MKWKKWILGAGLACLCLSLFGCGKRKEEPAVVMQEAPTQTPVPTVTPTPAGDLVEMAAVPSEKEAEKESFKNVVGEKKEGSLSVQVVNQTGEGLRSFFIRLHPEDDDEDWGEDLINGAFVLASKDVMLAYYQGKGQEAAQSTLYDLRIFQDDEDRSEFYFRNIPLQTVQRITLLMEGEGDDAIPYAKYVTPAGKEYSTLQEVKRRLGLLDEDDGEDYEEEPEESREEVEQVPLEDEVAEPQIEAEAAAEESLTPTPTAEPILEFEEIDMGDIEGDSFAVTDEMSTAMSFVGSSLEALESALGSSNGSDYVDEPETGLTGYYYYGAFTVSTTVGPDGSEIVTGVW